MTTASGPLIGPSLFTLASDWLITCKLIPDSLQDCINVADECICAITQLLPNLYEFNLQVNDYTVCYCYIQNGLRKGAVVRLLWHFLNGTHYISRDDFKELKGLRSNII